jgi:hypothetical protein
MSETPPPTQSTYNISMPARLPVPGNAEFLLWLVVEIVLVIVVWIADSVDVATWIDFTKWITAAYLISRGIAKASRVLEQ